jgi:lysophospholipase L1-like esterase
MPRDGHSLFSYASFMIALPQRVVCSVFAILLGLAPLSARASLEDEVRAYEAADAVKPPPAHPILFVGSSTIRMWSNLDTAFPRHTVLNRGFGGSQMSDAIFYFDRLVARYEPSLIVLYEGDNDLAAGKTVSQIFSDYTNFLSLVEAALPGTDVALVAVKPSPSRTDVLSQMADLNNRLETLADGRHIRFIDVYSPMLNASNQPRPELFLADMLHMNATGYELWQSIIAPVLDNWALGRGQEFLIDFGAATTPTLNGPAPNDIGNFWNNLTETNTVLTNLTTAGNMVTSLRLSVLSSFNGANEAGTTTSPTLPGNASRDSLFGNTEAFNNRSNVFPQFKLDGLDPGLEHYFSFFASRTGVSDNRETQYKVSGSNNAVAFLNAANNISNWAIFPPVTPDSSGELTVELTPSTNNNNANHFTYVGVMKLIVAPPQTPIAFRTQPQDQSAYASWPATFRIGVTGARPYYIQWLSNGVPIAGENQLTYTIPSVTSAMNGTVFSAVVSNILYGAASQGATLTVAADTNAPVLLSATALGSSSIELLFSEPLAIASIDAQKFQVNGSTVKTAVLFANGTSIRLTLVSPITGAFEVSASGVQDLSGNTITAGILASGTIPEPETQAILIDFGSSSTTEFGATPDDPENYWNNLTDPTGGIAQLVTVQNGPSQASLVMVRRFNGANLNGATSGVPFPIDATRDSFYGNTELFGGFSNIFPGFKITGLDPAQEYDLLFYASRTGVSDNRETLYTVEGAQTNTAVLNAANNLTNNATLTGLTPSAGGEFTIGLTPGPRNNNANHFTYLGIFKITPTLPLRFLTPVVLQGRIQLRWQTPAVLEWAVSPGGPWTTTAQAAQSFSEDILPGQSRFYRLRR